MSLFDRIAEQKIQAAIEAGDFDNLPGMGMPLKLDQDPFADPAWQMAAHMLKEGNFKLPWIEIRQEIEADLEKVRGRMRLAFDQQQTAARAELFQVVHEVD